MEWILILLAVNFLGGYVLGVISLFFYRRTQELRFVREKSATTRLACYILWPEKTDFIREFKRREKDSFIQLSDRPLYLGLMVLFGFYPKFLYILVISTLTGICYGLYRACSIPRLLGGLLIPKFIS